MDIATAGTLVSNIYPALRDITSYIMKRRGAMGNKQNFRDQVKEMVTVVQSDISQMKNEVNNIREAISGMNVVTGALDSAPWQSPPNVNGVQAWLYRRKVRRLLVLADEFRESLDGILDVISCCAGVMEGTLAVQSSDEEVRDPDWVQDVARSYEEVLQKLGSPHKYSIDDLTNEMERFLDQSRIALQKLARAV